MNTPTADYRRIEVPPLPRVPTGLDAAAHGAAGRVRRRAGVLRGLLSEAEEIAARSEPWGDRSDRRLREELERLCDGFRRDPESADARLPEALAVIREAARRATGLRPYPVQLAGALALARGRLAEMATGEGKTLTAALAAIPAAWTGRPCHVVTVNDYLAARDADWFQPLYRFCGVSVGAVTGEMDPAARRRGYDAGVTYTTSKEVVADFLRDRLRLGSVHEPARRLLRALVDPRTDAAERLVMRGLHTAIVDEADSVLIDEAVTPLIIAQPRHNRALQEACAAACRAAAGLKRGVHYRVDEVYREIEWRPAGEAWLEGAADAFPGIWRGAARRRELMEQALTARELFHRDRQYVVRDDEIVIVDEFTGRLMPNRNWSEGLHQAIEAKEGLALTEPDETLARLSFQRFFRLYRRLAGMTGTAREAAGELWQIYRLPVVAIPTNRPCIRREPPDRYFATAAAKWDAAVEAVAKVHAAGRAVLVGTRSVDASESLAARLAERELPFNLLNAVRHREEARIVAEAGQPGRITIATNMAGRGTDIKLGHGVAEAGGLHVLATERHTSRRIDRQLFGRCARQGDPGSAQALVSVEDELLTRFLPAAVRRRLAARVGQDAGGDSRAAATAVSYAQGTAQRLAYRQRRAVLRSDHWLEEALSFTGR